MKLPLSLTYTLPEGALAPYFDALRAGRALAARCRTCGRVRFPARIHCAECGGDTHDWHVLSGRVRVVLRTDGATASFALVRFDGADGNSLVKLTNPGRSATFGRLIAPEGDRPGLCVQLDERKTDDVRDLD